MTSRAGFCREYAASECMGSVTENSVWDCEVDGDGLFNAANCVSNTAIVNMLGESGVRHTFNSAASTAIAAAAVVASVVAYAL